MYRLTLLRHAETAWNAEGLLQGDSDQPLSSVGLWQAGRLRDRLAGQEFTAAYASDLARAIATAQTVLERHPAVPLTALPMLREVSFGAAEGLPYEAYQNDEGALLGGLAWRLGGWLAGLDLAASNEHLLVVAHGGPIRVLLCLLLSLPPQRHWSFHLDCAGITVVDCAPGLVTLRLLNDCSHLGHFP
jgi:broad specificity phosphatase PhoE